MQLEFPSNFKKNIKDLYGEEGADWLNKLPSLLSGIEEKYNLHFSHPAPQLSYHFVAVVNKRNSNDSYVLKMGPNSKNLRREFYGLSSYTEGVPAVMDFFENENAYLMQNLFPGTSLSEFVLKNDLKSTQVIANLIQKLHRNQNKKFINHFSHISEFMADTNILKNKIEAKCFSKWQSLLKDLTIKSKDDLILHGDLHHGNILKHGEDWFAIDPQAIIGDPVYETASMIFNPIDKWSEIQNKKQLITNRIKVLSEILSFDAEKIKAWAFCKILLAAAWNYEDHNILSNELIELAAFVDQLKLS